MPYEVWLVPTEQAKGSGLWVERRIHGPFENKDVADDVAYYEDHDDPAPDKHEFRSIVVRKV